jgi:hypothetical protein
VLQENNCVLYDTKIRFSCKYPLRLTQDPRQGGPQCQEDLEIEEWEEDSVTVAKVTLVVRDDAVGVTASDAWGPFFESVSAVIYGQI